MTSFSFSSRPADRCSYKLNMKIAPIQHRTVKDVSGNVCCSATAAAHDIIRMKSRFSCERPLSADLEQPHAN
jgi:hypothetical protein